MTSRPIIFPITNGIVRCIIPDGSNGWYVGGGFSTIGGIAKSNLAHVKSDKSIDAGFTADCNSEVRAIVKSGNKLYVGGLFTTVNSTARNYLASVNSSSGALTNNWDPSPNNQVYSVALVDTCIYIGGAFTKVGTYYQRYFSRVGINKGKVVGGLANADSYIQKIHPKGDTLYIGGNFTNVGFDAQYLASVSTTSDAPDINFPNTDGTVYVTVPDGSGGWYVGGSLTT
jgi:hypothetical protein